MTSVLNVDEIAAKDGTSPVALTKQSAAKATAVFDNQTTTTALTDSFNASSITDNGTGDQTISWTNSFDATPYAVAGVVPALTGTVYVRNVQLYAANQTDTTPSGMTTGSSRVLTYYIGSSSIGSSAFAYNSVTVHGDLA